jgi:hypothetical protein
LHSGRKSTADAEGESAMADAFWWREFDVRHLLPGSWQAEVVGVALSRARPHIIVPRSVTSREEDNNLRLPVLTVGGETIKEELPWLAELYSGRFRDLGQQCVQEPISTASQWRYAINLNVQKGEMRYECHVDSNPLQGLLYVTDQPFGSGGELVVARRADAVGPDEILHDADVICPNAGLLVFFDARQHPHFVTKLKDPNAIRVVIAMNYYTLGCPESARPPDLDKHLGLVRN